jgi:hypothetical protein
MSALRGAEAVATDIRYGTPLSSKVDVRHTVITTQAWCLSLGVNEKKGGARIAAIRKGG